MTKEVAEKIVRGITDKIECNTVDIDDWAEFWGFTREEYEEFLDVGVKALESQPCEDSISRTEALRLIDEERQHLLRLNMDGAEHIIVHYARRIIEDMPSASSVDCIDRQKTIAEIQYKYYDNAIGIDIVDMIAHMPAAIPEQLGEHFAEGYKKGVENEQTRT